MPVLVQFAPEELHEDGRAWPGNGRWTTSSGLDSIRHLVRWFAAARRADW